MEPDQQPGGCSVNAPLSRYLHLTAFMAGAAIMVIEILGARILSPFIGTSHFVWTAQIAVTLIALAVGYYAGGRLGDWWQKPAGLYWAMLGAAGWVLCSVPACEPVTYRCLELNLATGSLLASAILFFPPLALLAMTSPFLVRILTASVSGVGGQVGRLGAISTLGSFAGTMLVGYFLIPLLPNGTTMLATALLLVAVAGGYFLRFHPRPIIAPVLAGVLFLLILAMLSRSEHREFRYVIERYRGNSHFGQIQVLDRRDGAIRYFLNDNLIQNAYDVERKQSPLGFSYLLAGLPRLYSPDIRDVLVIGMGVGIVPLDFARQGARVDTVEINPAVVEVARRYFDFEPGRVAVTIGDGRQFLNKASRQYDVIILDAFIGDSFPSHLMTRETFAAARRLLRPGGTLVVHSFGELKPGKSFLLASLLRTLAAVFPHLQVHTNGDGVFYFVARTEPPPSALPRLPLDDVHPLARAEVEATLSERVVIPEAEGLVLTDDYNPADYFDAHNRESLRRRLALAARDM